ncbi:predicted protein [Nematostella vectensis]|uniref:DNA-directed RNA polymerase n=1 Tax=Nematostella vectensis TaxID=45351 RepID=A7RKW2_NEMVE|nr:predicted protein [Nematostella vectensis]|eukprot:XP_001639815.1 predicted protein [Nematostella vectensis]
MPNCQGFNPEYIFYYCRLTKSQAQGVKRAILLVDPSYKTAVPDSHYLAKHPTIVKSIYQERKHWSMNKSLEQDIGQHSEEVQALLDEQLQRELHGVTHIKSIEEVEEDKENKMLKSMFLEWKEKWKDSMIKELYPPYCSLLKNKQVSNDLMPRELWDGLDLGRPYDASLKQEIDDLPWATKLLCGCTLIDFLIQSVKIDANLFNAKSESLLPGFYHSYEFRERRKIGVIKPHSVVCKLFKGYLADHGDIAMPTTSLPMLVPPRPWRDIRDGGFLIQPVQLMRSTQEMDDNHDHMLRYKCDSRELSAVLDSLNYLGTCAWKTNNRILDLAIQVFNDQGDDTLAIPGPVVPLELEPLEKSVKEPEARMKQIQEHRRARKLAREHYSLRMTALYKLSVANHFRDRVFWLPLNMDFRGRVYPIPPHCCHVGHRIATLLEDKVTRRVVKQTVMTIVYGVTFVGGRLQIERQLKDLDLDERVLFEASAYLVHKVFASIGQMFTRAKAIQDWFALSATHIAYTGHCVDWYTPLSLYVCQPYCKKAVKTIKTRLQGIEIPTQGFAMSVPDSRKQRAAFPPNFVHSLDSTHMMLTAVHCQRAGINFASVHDSFWTHAAHIDIMNRLCREQFVSLHTQPILQDLQTHFVDNYGGLKFMRPLKKKDHAPIHNATFEGLPEIGDFDVSEVLDSTYFFC